MKYGTIRGIKKSVSRIAQGTIMISRAKLDESFRLLDAALEGGCNMFDTAHCYGEDNERLPGEWVKSRGIRDKIVMLAKGAHPDAGGKRCNPKDITEQLNQSLERMQFDYIDLYVLHRDDPDVPVKEIVDCLNEHHAAGRIHAFGGSNWTYERVKEANEYAEANGLVPFAVSSPNFSLAVSHKPMWGDCVSVQGPDGADAREWYARTNMALVTWSSIARGFFSGRFRSAEEEKKNEILEACARDAFCYPDNFKRLERVYELADERGMAVPQVALAYVLNYPLDIFALVGACTPEEFRENLAALELALTPAEMAWLNLEADAR